jgi:hypothetical protein
MCIAFPPAFEFARTKKEVDSHDSKTDQGSHGQGSAGAQQVGLPDVFKPQCHIFYERRVMDIKDGVIKWRKHKDTEEMGEEERP